MASSLTAIGSFAALVTAIWAARAAWRQVEHLNEQQRHRDERDEQEQASQVAAWLTYEGKGEGCQLIIHYVNHSKLPVFDVACYIPGYWMQLKKASSRSN